jgi:FkbM family methyltransferase
VPHAPTETSFTCNAWWSGDEQPVVVRLDGHDAADKIAYVIRTQKTFWEVDQLEYIAMVGPRGGIYLDVGSNIGNHAVFFGLFCADHVVAIEPNPRLHPILRRNIDANALGERTTVVPFGISDTEGAGSMALRDEHGGNIGASHIVPGPAATAGECVRLRRLDDLIAELAPSLPSLPVTFLKIDVEGMEMGVLCSATTLLREHRPQIFVELITEDAFERAASLLREFGYIPVDRLGSPPSYHFIVPGRHALRQQMARGQPSLTLNPHGGTATGGGHSTRRGGHRRRPRRGRVRQFDSRTRPPPLR